MRNLIRIEELFLFGLSLFLFSQLDYAWWIYPALFFSPDVSMIGYLGGPRSGAVVYNIVHHKAIAIGFYFAGFFISVSLMQLMGVILLGHSSLDRVLGYGLKYPDSFNNTHLDMIGRWKA